MVGTSDFGFAPSASDWQRESVGWIRGSVESVEVGPVRSVFVAKIDGVDRSLPEGSIALVVSIDEVGGDLSTKVAVGSSVTVLIPVWTGAEAPQYRDYVDSVVRAGLPAGTRVLVTPYKVIGVGHIYMRTDQPPFNDVRVRRAVSLAIDRKAWNDALLFGEGCIDSGPIPCAMTDWKLDAAKMDPAKVKTLVGYDPAEAKRLLAQAGHPKGFTTPMFNWPGYVSPWRSYYELAAEALGKVGITVELKPEEYGKYISTTYLGKFEKMAMGPSTPFTEVDDFLYGTHFPEQPNNRSSVADAELNKLLVAQRRELDPKKRKEIVDEIQRYLADKQYYVYVPQWPQYVSHPPYVKGFKHHDGYGLGLRLMYTWLDK
ncbi:MAG: ABC transporter substrate-binding protein [candidate division NC10 bacterium]